MKSAPMTLVDPEPAIEEKVPDFAVLDKTLKVVKLDDLNGKIKVISVTLSLFTPVCDLQVHGFNEEEASILSRYFQTTEMLLSERAGGLIKELRLPARSVFVADKENVLRYGEIIPEATNPPGYDPALAVLKKIFMLFFLISL